MRLRRTRAKTTQAKGYTLAKPSEHTHPQPGEEFGVLSHPERERSANQQHDHVHQAGLDGEIAEVFSDVERVVCELVGDLGGDAREHEQDGQQAKDAEPAPGRRGRFDGCGAVDRPEVRGQRIRFLPLLG